MKEKLKEVEKKYLLFLADDSSATQDEKDMLKFLTDSSANQNKETALRHFFSVLGALTEIEKL